MNIPCWAKILSLLGLAVTLPVVGFLLGGNSERGGAARSDKDFVTPEEIVSFIEHVKNDLVFVGGGRFMMGDFGVLYGAEGLPYDIASNSKPVHEVLVDSYSMSKYKITNSEFKFYLKLTQQEVDGANEVDTLNPLGDHPRLPAHLDWFEASKYCQWLGEKSGLPFSLPTEAQWEYAARSGGLFVAVATDDGTFRKTNETHGRDGRHGSRGLNMATSADRLKFAQEMGWNYMSSVSLPVDMFPPNPLGIYSIADNGFEWVSDWYDPNYYRASKFKNPRGPLGPIYKDASSNNKYAKVLRGADDASSYPVAVTVRRDYRNPDALHTYSWSDKRFRLVSDLTARCVVNASVPVE